MISSQNHNFIILLFYYFIILLFYYFILFYFILFYFILFYFIKLIFFEITMPLTPELELTWYKLKSFGIPFCNPYSSTSKSGIFL
ncbi:hypothetical protein OA40_09515 [Morganella morganii]|nr:hypothetical protein OA40_09515 [Morganella morganii]